MVGSAANPILNAKRSFGSFAGIVVGCDNGLYICRQSQEMVVDRRVVWSVGRIDYVFRCFNHYGWSAASRIADWDFSGDADRTRHHRKLCVSVGTLHTALYKQRSCFVLRCTEAHFARNGRFDASPK